MASPKTRPESIGVAATVLVCLCCGRLVFSSFFLELRPLFLSRNAAFLTQRTRLQVLILLSSDAFHVEGVSTLQHPLLTVDQKVIQADGTRLCWWWKWNITGVSDPIDAPVVGSTIEPQYSVQLRIWSNLVQNVLEAHVVIKGHAQFIIQHADAGRRPLAKFLQFPSKSWYDVLLEELPKQLILELHMTLPAGDRREYNGTVASGSDGILSHGECIEMLKTSRVYVECFVWMCDYTASLFVSVQEEASDTG